MISPAQALKEHHVQRIATQHAGGGAKGGRRKASRGGSRALQDPEVRSRIEKMGVTVTDQSPEIAARALADEAGFLADVARKIGMEPQ